MNTSAVTGILRCSHADWMPTAVSGEERVAVSGQSDCLIQQQGQRRRTCVRNADSYAVSLKPELFVAH